MILWTWLALMIPGMTMVQTECIPTRFARYFHDHFLAFAFWERAPVLVYTFFTTSTIQMVTDSSVGSFILLFEN